MNHKFQIIGFTDNHQYVDSPKLVLRVVNAPDQLIVDSEIEASHDGLEDPQYTDFLFVLAETQESFESGKKWKTYYSNAICEFRGQIIVCKWIARPMGSKGQTALGTGYYYAPYVPLTQTPVVLDPASFKSQRGILTRYGKKLLSEGAKYYASKHIIT